MKLLKHQLVCHLWKLQHFNLRASYKNRTRKQKSASDILLCEQTQIHASNTDTAIIQIAQHQALLPYTNETELTHYYLPTNRATMLITSTLAEIASLTHI